MLHEEILVVPARVDRAKMKAMVERRRAELACWPTGQTEAAAVMLVPKNNMSFKLDVLKILTKSCC
jgi:hypothetical protein